MKIVVSDEASIEMRDVVMVPARILLDERLRAHDIVVFVALAAFCDDGGHSSVSYSTIARTAHIAKSSAQLAIARLERMRLVTKTPQHQRDGRASEANLYFLGREYIKAC